MSGSLTISNAQAKRPDHAVARADFLISDAELKATFSDRTIDITGARNSLKDTLRQAEGVRV
jgi:hypothetical protein